MHKQDEQFVDQLLDASIEHCASAEPRAGLEGRILAGVAARHRAVQRQKWALGLAASALAILAVAVTTRILRHTTIVSLPHPPQIAAVRPESMAPPAPIARSRVTRLRRSKAITQRPQQFPTPAPLSEQEKLLLLYVQETPKSVLATPVNTPNDLEIPDLKIAALEIKDLPRAKDEN